MTSTTETQETKHRARSVVAVLADRDIIRERKRGNIIIEPFDTNSLSNTSYDIQLGEYFFRSNPNATVLNPWCAEHVHAYWGKSLQAPGATKEEAQKYGLREGDRFILLKPFESILAHTNEFIGGKNYITTMMKARSSVGRCRIQICACAGWGDVGFINRWAMEIQNMSNADAILPIGCRIGQIVFMYTNTVNKDYAKNGKYQDSTDVEVLKKNWKPEHILPRLQVEKVSNIRDDEGKEDKTANQSKFVAKIDSNKVDKAITLLEQLLDKIE